ncbi:hypothetical protein RHSIM_Rhsim05G0031900 [Rhododendron simsii]|uniref:Uncharacterized protein n=1 Tax=Rhododendron simsii TaxID=118357 RepID=A0A834LQP8_RHOSS|nr:hypothetical protein RHSIM_Rhsim05G0031900 [Rhododendron simsii]
MPPSLQDLAAAPARSDRSPSSAPSTDTQVQPPRPTPHHPLEEKSWSLTSPRDRATWTPISIGAIQCAGGLSVRRRRGRGGRCLPERQVSSGDDRISGLSSSPCLV